MKSGGCSPLLMMQEVDDKARPEVPQNSLLGGGVKQRIFSYRFSPRDTRYMVTAQTSAEYCVDGSLAQRCR
jgi:hypothetical protein